MLQWDFDASYQEVYGIVAGTDEAGRGPLAGPVVAGAVILPKDFHLEYLDDSKKLTEKKREKLFDQITAQAISYGIGQASPEEIDQLNILNASLLAMRRAIEQLSPTPNFVLVDGNVNRGFLQPAKSIVGGDAKSPSIAAASILAKVTRDRLMTELDKQYPEYGLQKHKGYPTASHMAAVHHYGPSPIHRKSFLSFLEKDPEKMLLLERQFYGESIE